MNKLDELERRILLLEEENRLFLKHTRLPDNYWTSIFDDGNLSDDFLLKYYERVVQYGGYNDYLWNVKLKENIFEEILKKVNYDKTIEWKSLHWRINVFVFKSLVEQDFSIPFILKYKHYIKDISFRYYELPNISFNWRWTYNAVCALHEYVRIEGLERNRNIDDNIKKKMIDKYKSLRVFL